MTLHAMNVLRLAIDYVNYGQVPVITMDQLLYTIAKAIQWTLTSLEKQDGHYAGRLAY